MVLRLLAAAAAAAAAPAGERRRRPPEAEKVDIAADGVYGVPSEDPPPYGALFRAAVACCRGRRRKTKEVPRGKTERASGGGWSGNTREKRESEEGKKW